MISWEKKRTINIYSHCTRNTFTFSVFVVVVVASLFLGNLRQEAEVFIHTRLLRVNMIAWKSKKNQQCVMLLNLQLPKMLVYFYFLFSHSNLFLVHGSIFDM